MEPKAADLAIDQLHGKAISKNSKPMIVEISNVSVSSSCIHCAISGVVYSCVRCSGGGSLSCIYIVLLVVWYIHVCDVAEEVHSLAFTLCY